jgi:Fur family peroxide stress response transcriptional regulator
MQNNETDTHIAHFIDTCRRHKLKITPQRVAVYREVMQSRQHPTANMIFSTIKLAFPNISFDTVNRTLMTFAEIGVVDVVEGFGGPKRFDPDTNAHHHLHCTACGRINDFKYEGYAQLDVPEAISRTFTVTSMRVVLKGICEACNRHSSSSMRQSANRRTTSA